MQRRDTQRHVLCNGVFINNFSPARELSNTKIKVKATDKKIEERRKTKKKSKYNSIFCCTRWYGKRREYDDFSETGTAVHIYVYELIADSIYARVRHSSMCALSVIYTFWCVLFVKKIQATNPYVSVCAANVPVYNCIKHLLVADFSTISFINFAFFKMSFSFVLLSRPNNDLHLFFHGSWRSPFFLFLSSE